MSRRGRSRSRAAKYYVSRDPWEEDSRPSRTAVAVASRPLRRLERRALRVFEHLRDSTIWDGDPFYGGHTSTEIRQALGIAPPAKFLNEALTSMRVRGLLHFELDSQSDGILRWWRTDAGVEALAEAVEGE
jgi:hypothetical protein